MADHHPAAAAAAAASAPAASASTATPRAQDLHQPTSSTYPGASLIRRRVCVAVDGSDHARRALAWALDNILDPARDQLLILYCHEPVTAVKTPAGLVFMEPDSDFDRLEDAARAASHDLLRAIANDMVPEPYIDNLKLLALRGDPATELEWAANEYNADVMVVASRGMGLVSRLLVGSVSDHLLHSLHIPVIVVKDQTTTTKKDV